jgi:ribosomal protein S4E
LGERVSSLRVWAAVHPIESTKIKVKQSTKLKDGAQCKVVGGTHDGKEGTVRDVNTSKTGHVTITVVQANGERFKTLAKNVVVRG